MDVELVDLSLFDAPPAIEHPYGAIFNSQITNEALPWHDLTVPNDFSSHQADKMKPLPPIPPRFARCRSDCAGNDLCILARIKRARTDNFLREQSQRHLRPPERLQIAPGPPPRTVSAPPPPARDQSESGPSSPSNMIWLPDDEMWLVRVDRASETNQIPAYRPPSIQRHRSYFPTRPLTPPFPSDGPPVRTDFHHVNRRPNEPPGSDELFMPLFQEAVPSMSLDRAHRRSPTPPPPYETDRGLRSRSVTQERSENQHGSMDPIRLQDDHEWEAASHYWAGVARRVTRSASADP